MSFETTKTTMTRRYGFGSNSLAASIGALKPCMTEAAIRHVDPHRILWLDGNTFTMQWEFFTKASPNCVYALHSYTYIASSLDDKQQSRHYLPSFLVESSRTPIWNGGFGLVYVNSALDANAEDINAARYNVLGAQLDIYNKHKIHWNISTIKDWLARKRKLQLDAWGRYPSKELDAVMNPLYSCGPE
ncbi:glycoside hydrolase family 5 protein [Lepidopterella palustris CBS 459.81]|uniref:Glycoside hydrolase family 5 protein n=1 Tax=Lepidopterella palustris CBS 459.81 TaxID=1314670 RepID=A0A8E2JHI3_9PEZI|nr:glycoside hydrolase family 5 protein [Lepidopterella palustris CBS 459.81]